MFNPSIQTQLAQIKPMVHLPAIEYGSIPEPVPTPVNSQRFCSAFFQVQLGWMLVGRDEAQEQAARKMRNALCYNNNRNITETHVRYDDWEQVKQSLQLLPTTLFTNQTIARSVTLPQAVVSLMYPPSEFQRFFSF